jgi:hypothetical protein
MIVFYGLDDVSCSISRERQICRSRAMSHSAFVDYGLLLSSPVLDTEDVGRKLRLKFELKGIHLRDFLAAVKLKDTVHNID